MTHISPLDLSHIMGIFAFYDADTDGTVYHVMPEPCQTDDDNVSMFHSETESSTSGMTIRTDDVPGYFVVHNGRQHPAIDGVVRWFPSDNIRRYILRSLVGKWVFGGNYVGPVKDALAPRADGGQRCALELGTRAGTWIQEMAREFPHVHFCSADVAPIIAHAPRANITFEVYDLTKGLLVPDASQDVVFLNVVFEVVKDYHAILREAHRVLRPGGLLHINDFNPHLWDPQNPSIPARHTHPIGCRVFDIARAHLTKLGLDPDTCDHLPRWLSDLGFNKINSKIKTYPVHPHEGGKCEFDPRVVPYVAHLSVMSTRDMAGLLVDTGMSADAAVNLVEDMIEEMRRPELSAMLKVYGIWAVKE